MLSRIWIQYKIQIIVSLIFFLICSLLIIFFHKNIYQFISNLKYGPLYSNIYTWKKSNYSFKENNKKSKQYFEHGIKELINLGNDTFNLNVNNSIKKAKITKDWHYSLSIKQIHVIGSMFNELQKYCHHSFINDTKVMPYKLDIKKRINKNQIKELRKNLLNINDRYFYYAYEKKPNAINVISIRESIYNALCKKHLVLALWQTSLNYLEYLAHKKVYLTKNIDKNNHYAFFLKEIFSNTEYKKFLENFYFKFNMNFSKPTLHSAESWKLYVFSKKLSYLNEYFKALLKECRWYGINLCRKNLSKLLDLKEKSQNSVVYLSSLAEVALRAKEFQLSKKNLTLLENRVYPKTVKKPIERMQTLLTFYGY